MSKSKREGNDVFTEEGYLLRVVKGPFCWTDIEQRPKEREKVMHEDICRTGIRCQAQGTLAVDRTRW